MMTLTDLRKKNGYTQNELGNLLGVSQQQIAKYEDNKSKPSTKVLKRIIEVFKLDLQEAWDMFYKNEQ